MSQKGVGAEGARRWLMPITEAMGTPVLGTMDHPDSGVAAQLEVMSMLGVSGRTLDTVLEKQNVHTLGRFLKLVRR